MTYLALNAVFLVAAGVIAAVAVTRRRRTPGPSIGRGALCVVVAMLTVLLLTALFDNIMISAGLFTYEPGLISGLTVGLAPVEDFAYPIAAALLLPAVWSLLGGPKPARRRTTT